MQWLPNDQQKYKMHISVTEIGRYIYGRIVNIENIETKIIYKLMIVANELEFEELSEKLKSCLVESKASWLRTHFSHIYHLIFDSNKCNEFKDFENNFTSMFTTYSLFSYFEEKFLQLPQRINELISTIINEEHVAEISS
ncbi:hypothetical protein Glove_290g35 [Diversispora epigaea]|uniref:Uncharacterized protein n=1 Tax=Diversispora epigaea TaxID=1348612 RepID=A0A397I4C1_9GLOM|nr:hypothetical protein Glove_290g35 [Diversispora epigaea]